MHDRLINVKLEAWLFGHFVYSWGRKFMHTLQNL